MNHPVRSLFLALLLAVCVPVVGTAETPIHRCTSADGSVVYSQLPCKDEAPVEADAPPPAEIDELPLPPPEKAETRPPDEEEEYSEANESKAACKKRYREEIDAIDAEIRREYSREKDADYKQRLLTLTRKLRAC